MFKHLPPLTKFLLFANMAVYGLQLLTGDVLLLRFALWPLGEGVPMEFGQELVTVQFLPWQLVTYGFLHGSPIHLAFNMLALYMFGGPLERLWGTRPFVLFYFLCVVGAGLMQLYAVGSPTGASFTPTIGASGGVMGLLLGFGMMYPNERIMLIFPPIPMPAWLFVILYGLMELYLGLSSRMPTIAHFAHLGGMAAGFVLIQYWRGRLPFKPRRILTR